MVVAIIGWVLPVMPGWPFFFVALWLVGKDNAVGLWCHERTHHLRQRAHEFLDRRRKAK